MFPTYAPIDGVKLSSSLASLPEVSAKLGGAPAQWRVREVGDGSLNLVFIVEGPAGGLVGNEPARRARYIPTMSGLRPIEMKNFRHEASCGIVICG